MRDFICQACEKKPKEDAHSCPFCNAIATAEHAPPVRRESPPEETTRSILKEHHPSFVGIFLSFFAIWFVIIALLFCFMRLGAERAIQAP